MLESLPDHWMKYAGLVGGAVVIAAVAPLNRIWWRRRLEIWARGEGLALVSFRGAATWEGPEKFTRSENQTLFYIQAKRPGGEIRSGWVMFGSFWGFTLGMPFAYVQWDR